MSSQVDNDSFLYCAMVITPLPTSNPKKKKKKCRMNLFLMGCIFLFNNNPQYLLPSPLPPKFSSDYATPRCINIIYIYIIFIMGKRVNRAVTARNLFHLKCVILFLFPKLFSGSSYVSGVCYVIHVQVMLPTADVL